MQTASRKICISHTVSNPSTSKGCHTTDVETTFSIGGNCVKQQTNATDVRSSLTNKLVIHNGGNSKVDVHSKTSGILIKSSKKCGTTLSDSVLDGGFDCATEFNNGTSQPQSTKTVTLSVQDPVSTDDDISEVNMQVDMFGDDNADEMSNQPTDVLHLSENEGVSPGDDQEHLVISPTTQD